ncbi:pentapeptide repeat-containing protein [Agrobacterium vitis]
MQQQLDDVLQQHKIFLSSVPAPKLERNGPYAPIQTASLTIQPMNAKETDAFPPSVTGNYKPVDDTTRADLCGAKLINLDFRRADLRFARLMGARIEGGNFDGVNLSWAYLRRTGFDRKINRDRARLYNADLTGIIIVDSDFSNWDFEESDLSFAIIGRSSFSGSGFDSTNLTGTTFRDVSMLDATFYRAQIAHTRLEVRPGHLPSIPSLRDVAGLTSLHALNGGAASLVEIREQLKRAGFNLQAQEVNYAINTYSDDNGFPGAKLLSRILFGIPYAFGMRPERTLLTAVLLIPIFSLFYFRALRPSPADPSTGIWVIRSAPKTNPKRLMRPVRLSRKNCQLVRTALWFSVLSAFRIGWHELNVGDWIARIQASDYKFEADGWPRMVSGLQSLVSVYLLALAIASYISK